MTHRDSPSKFSTSFAYAEEFEFGQSSWAVGRRRCSGRRGCHWISAARRWIGYRLGGSCKGRCWFGGGGASNPRRDSKAL